MSGEGSMLEPVPAEATPPAERDDDTMTTAIRQRMRNQRSVGLQKLKARCHNIAYGYYIPAFDIPSFFGQLSLHAEVMPPLGYYIVKTDRSGEEEVPKLWKKKGWNVKDGPPRERPPRPEDDLVVDLEHTYESQEESDEEVETFEIKREAERYDEGGVQRSWGRYPLRDEYNGIYVCEPIDFSEPGEISTMVYHYTQRKTVSLIYDNKQEMLVGGWLPVEYIQAGMLVTEGSGTFGDGIYTTPLEPSSFRDKEAVCANNFGSQQHRKEKYGPGGEMSRLPDGKGWEWLDADGNSSPLGHHLVEVCLPLRVSVKDLAKVPNPDKHTAEGRAELERTCRTGDESVYVFVPPSSSKKGRLAGAVSPILQLLQGIVAEDLDALTKLLANGAISVMHTFNKDVPDHFIGSKLLHMAAGIVDSVTVFQFLEKLGAPYEEDVSGMTPLDIAAAASHMKVFRWLFKRIIRGGSDVLCWSCYQGHSECLDATLMLAARMGSAEAVNVLIDSATTDVRVEHGAICKAAREMHKWKTAVEAIKAAAAAAGSPVTNRAEFSKLMRDAAQAEEDKEKKTTKAADTIGGQIVDDIDVTGLGKDDDYYAEEADAKVKSGKGKRAMLLLLSTVDADGYDEVKAVLTDMLSRRPWNYHGGTAAMRDVAAIFAWMDKGADGNSLISRAQMEKLMLAYDEGSELDEYTWSELCSRAKAKRKVGISYPQLLNAFAKDGYIWVYQLTGMVAKLCNIQAMFAWADKDKDGKLNRVEYNALQVAVGDKAKSANKWKEICARHDIDPAVGIDGAAQLWKVEEEDPDVVNRKAAWLQVGTTVDFGLPAVDHEKLSKAQAVMQHLCAGEDVDESEEEEDEEAGDQDDY